MAMAKNKSKAAEDDDYDDESVDDSLDDFEEIELKEIVLISASNARRRHEQLKEERELERLLRNDFYDWDY